MPPGSSTEHWMHRKQCRNKGKWILADASRKFHGISDVQKSIAEIWMRRKQLFMDFCRNSKSA